VVTWPAATREAEERDSGNEVAAQVTLGPCKDPWGSFKEPPGLCGDPSCPSIQAFGSVYRKKET